MHAKTRIIRASALTLLGLAALLGGCGKQAPDHDGDGFDAIDDCNDANAATKPDAAEVCGDGLDNDCDLAVDGADSDCAP